MTDYSKLRKELQEKGEAPPFYTTGGIQLFYDKYSNNNETPKSRYKSIARALAKHAPKIFPDWWETDVFTKGKTWSEVFFDVMWYGYISPSTPLLSNGGLRKKGTTVSCSGGLLDNNLYDRYNTMTEAAILTKHSHGTSYAIKWPADGDPIPRGGFSDGIMPVIRDIITTMDEVVQASRRGSISYGVDIEHGDFQKILDNVYKNPEANNPAWIITNKFIEKLNNHVEEALARIGDVLATKLMRGRGYFNFIDKMQNHLSQVFKDHGLETHASNLCTEVLLPASEKYTYTCVILNTNLELYREWPEHLNHIAHIMSDCNITEYLQTIKGLSKQDQKAMKKAYDFTKDFRAIGTGVLGLHTLFQKERIIYGSLESFYLNAEIFKRMQKETYEANRWLAMALGVPKGCVGHGLRNATTMMMPPTKSTAEIMAGASEGIGLDVGMVFTKQSAGGEFFRVNKVLLDIMKERGVYNEDTIKQIAQNKGSVQGDKFPWLTEHEKKVFRIAFEIPMEDHINLCAQRQQWIDQMQSINLYFTSNDSEEYISEIHKLAFDNPMILSLYYIYSMRGSGEIQRATECESCQ